MDAKNGDRAACGYNSVAVTLHISCPPAVDRDRALSLLNSFN
ncbi:MAG: hypothetical protein ABI180_15870 [Microcoleus sp.]